VARASSSKRRSRSSSSPRSDGSTLTATSRPRRGSLARKTSPIPPEPRRSSISYGPSCAPTSTGMVSPVEGASAGKRPSTVRLAQAASRPGRGRTSGSNRIGAGRRRHDLPVAAPEAMRADPNPGSDRGTALSPAADAAACRCHLTLFTGAAPDAATWRCSLALPLTLPPVAVHCRCSLSLPLTLPPGAVHERCSLKLSDLSRAGGPTTRPLPPIHETLRQTVHRNGPCRHFVFFRANTCILGRNVLESVAEAHRASRN